MGLFDFFKRGSNEEEYDEDFVEMTILVILRRRYSRISLMRFFLDYSSLNVVDYR